MSLYNCQHCEKTYKTHRGLVSHVAKKHETKDDKIEDETKDDKTEEELREEAVLACLMRQLVVSDNLEARSVDGIHSEFLYKLFSPLRRFITNLKTDEEFIAYQHYISNNNTSNPH